MKAMEFLTLLGELDETAAAPVGQHKKRRALWVAAAACFCACLLGFSAWFFVPPNTAVSSSAKYVTIRLDDRLASYCVINTATLSRFERMCLPDTPGEVLCIHGDNTFYRPKGEDDLVYVIQERGDGSYAVLEFVEYDSFAGVDLTESFWYTSGWLTDEDIAALNWVTEPTMGEVWETVYGVASSEAIRSIRLEKDHAHNGGVDKTVQVKSVTVRDREALERLYGLLAPMTPAAYGQDMDFGHVDAYDEAYLNGESPLSAQVNRDLTVTMDSGREVTLTYYPAVGLLYQHGTGLYAVLSDADNQWLIDLGGIDVDWKDWGTEEPFVYGEGCETASVPEGVVTERPID